MFQHFQVILCSPPTVYHQMDEQTTTGSPGQVSSSIKSMLTVGTVAMYGDTVQFVLVDRTYDNHNSIVSTL